MICVCEYKVTINVRSFYQFLCYIYALPVAVLFFGSLALRTQQFDTPRTIKKKKKYIYIYIFLNLEFTTKHSNNFISQYFHALKF